MRGRSFRDLRRSALEANEAFEVGFGGSSLLSGVYIIRLISGSQVKNLKLMIKK